MATRWISPVPGYRQGPAEGGLPVDSAGGSGRSREDDRGDIITRWPVVRETAVVPEDLGLESRPNDAALQRWFDGALGAYLERCASLRASLESGAMRLVTSRPSFDRLAPLSPGDTVLVAVSVTELRSSSFDVAMRIRHAAEGGSGAMNGRCRVALVDIATGTAVVFPGAMRAELMAVEAGASDYC